MEYQSVALNLISDYGLPNSVCQILLAPIEGSGRFDYRFTLRLIGWPVGDTIMKIFSRDRKIGLLIGCFIFCCVWFIPMGGGHSKSVHQSNFTLMVGELNRKDENASGVGQWIVILLLTAAVSLLIGISIRWVLNKTKSLRD